jgi:hypothetical protein
LKSAISAAVGAAVPAIAPLQVGSAVGFAQALAASSSVGSDAIGRAAGSVPGTVASHQNSPFDSHDGTSGAGFQPYPISARLVGRSFRSMKPRALLMIGPIFVVVFGVWHERNE